MLTLPSNTFPSNTPSRRSRLSILTISLAVLLTFASHAGAEFFYVGAGADCDANTIGGGLFLAALNGPGTDTIIIARNQTYTAQKLFISNHSVILQGGYEDCSGTVSTEPTIIDGAGGVDDVVIEYNATDGTTYTQMLRNLHIRGGEQGGVKVQGTTSFSLSDTIVSDHMGPGIQVDGSGARATVLAGSIVRQNQAAEGAGVHCRNGSVTIRGTVADNEATSHGGGVYLSSCHLEMNGEGAGRVSGNRAGGNGGGIYSLNGLVNLRGNSGGPISIEGNHADGHGGGMFITVQALTARNTHIVDNTSLGYGGGVYGTLGARISLSRNADCPDPQRCSRLSGNVAEGSAGVSGGGALALTLGSEATILQTYVEENRAGGLDWGGAGSVAHVGNNSTLNLGMSVLARNDGVEAVYLDTGAADLLVYGVTSADQTVSGETGHSFLSARDAVPVEIKTSIITEQLRPDMNGDLSINGLLVTSAQGTLPGDGVNVIVGDPMFVDAAFGNYMLSADSPAVDATTYQSFGFFFYDRDAHWQSRGFLVDNLATRYDFGALESRGPWVELFVDGFELGDLSAWSE